MNLYTLHTSSTKISLDLQIDLTIAYKTNLKVQNNLPFIHIFSIHLNTIDPEGLLPQVHPREAEGAEVGVCAPHGRLYGFSKQLLYKLANKRPHVFYSLI